MTALLPKAAARLDVYSTAAIEPKAVIDRLNAQRRDMNSQKLHDWLQIVGIAAVVGSLMFVGLQIKQSDDIALAEVFESSAARGIERRTLVAEHADTWQKACLGEELDASERVIAANIYFVYLQGNFNTWQRYRITGLGGVDPRYLVDAFAANIHRYPGFKRLAVSWDEWAKLGARFDDEIAKEYSAAVLQRVSELEQLEPEPAADVMWCGVR